MSSLARRNAVITAAVIVTLATLLLPAFLADAVSAVVILVVVAVAVRAGLRDRGSATSRPLGALAILFLGLTPFVSELDRSVRGSVTPDAGDLTAVIGYLLLISFVRRLVLLRTVAPQAQVTADAAAFAASFGLAALVGPLHVLIERQSGPELATTVVYAGFALVLVFYLMKLALGAEDRSPAFRFLVAASGLAASSEGLFMIGAAWEPYLNRLGGVAATVAIVSFVAAITHPSARSLESPRPPRHGGLGRVWAFTFVASALALVTLPLLVDIQFLEGVGIVLVGAVMTWRVLVSVADRDHWMRLDASMREFAEEAVHADHEARIRRAALDAGDRALVGKELATHALDLGDGGVVSDPRGFSVTMDDPLVARTRIERRSQREEMESHGTRARYASRVAVPIDLGDETGVWLLECAPVLTPTEIQHVEMVAASLGSALTTHRLRERRESERANRRFGTLVQDGNDIVAVVDPETTVVELVSPTIRRLLELDPDDVVGRPASDLVHVEDRLALASAFAGEVSPFGPVDTRLIHADGAVRWYSVRARDLEDDPDLDGVIVSFTDVHDRKMAELQLGTSERRYRTLVETSNEIFAVIGPDREITFVSPNVERVLGFSPNELLGNPVSRVFSARGKERAEELRDLERHEIDGRVDEIEIEDGNGQRRWLEVSIAVGDDPSEDELVVTARDVTARRDLEKDLRRAALHDSLTGLFNRSALQFELNRALQTLDSDEVIGVLHLDAREFRVVNESLGFEAGDRLIVDIADRVRSGLRAEDLFARLDADNFVILTRAESVRQVERFARRLHRMFDEPFTAGGRARMVTMDIGIAVATSRRDNATALLEQAAIAVRRSKVDGSAPLVFQKWMKEQANERFELESDLLPGLRRREFALVYQPLLLLANQRVRGVEALIRWNHPERGIVSPGSFIPVAESSGAIVELGRWVLAEACAQLVTWHRDLPGGEGLGVSVNVSARQLEEADEFDRLTEIIEESGASFRAITLELTETRTIAEVPNLQRGLQSLRDRGVKIAVDDFGSGTAGLNHLRDVPFDVLKFDRSYVDKLGKSRETEQLLEGLVEVAHHMGAIVVGEGVETPAQAQLLKQMGCDVGQGFFLGRPMEPARLENWFAQGREGNLASQIEQPSV